MGYYDCEPRGQKFRRYNIRTYVIWKVDIQVVRTCTCAHMNIYIYIYISTHIHGIQQLAHFMNRVVNLSLITEKVSTRFDFESGLQWLHPTINHLPTCELPCKKRHPVWSLQQVRWYFFLLGESIGYCPIGAAKASPVNHLAVANMICSMRFGDNLGSQILYSQNMPESARMIINYSCSR